MSALLPVGQRVIVVGGPSFGKAGAVTCQPIGYPQWYVVRLDGVGGPVLVAPYNLEPVRS